MCVCSHTLVTRGVFWDQPMNESTDEVVVALLMQQKQHLGLIEKCIDTLFDVELRLKKVEDTLFESFEMIEDRIDQDKEWNMDIEWLDVKLKSAAHDLLYEPMKQILATIDEAMELKKEFSNDDILELLQLSTSSLMSRTSSTDQAQDASPRSSSDEQIKK